MFGDMLVSMTRGTVIVETGFAGSTWLGGVGCVREIRELVTLNVVCLPLHVAWKKKAKLIQNTHVTKYKISVTR